MKARSRQVWSIGAVLGIAIGVALLMAGEWLAQRGLLLGGAIVVAVGLLCGVVRVASNFPET